MTSGRLLLPAWLVVLAGCGASLDPKLVSAGRDAYLAEGCPACHGRQGEGGSMGPDLRRAGRHWNADGLSSYLADPTSHREREIRLQRLSRVYSAHMPAFATLPEDRRAALAAYLLSR